MSLFFYGNHDSPATDETIGLQQVKQNIMFTNHVTEGWGLNLLSSHSWCNVLGFVDPLQSCLPRVQISYAIHYH